MAGRRQEAGTVQLRCEVMEGRPWVVQVAQKDGIVLPTRRYRYAHRALAAVAPWVAEGYRVGPPDVWWRLQKLGEG
jgi:hypothetical protein